ncbi:MAG: leucine-rich repeat protein [Clostridia bacterium]
METKKMCELNASQYCACDCVEVDDEKFCGCSAIKTVELLKATAIGKNAFDGCVALKSVIMPQVEKIESGAFANCNVDAKLFVDASKIVKLGKNWNACDCKVFAYSCDNPFNAQPPLLCGEVRASGWWHFSSDGVTPLLWA